VRDGRKFYDEDGVYHKTSEAAKEVVWIKKFVFELCVFPSAPSHLDLYCDNNGAITQAKDPRCTKSSNRYTSAI